MALPFGTTGSLGPAFTSARLDQSRSSAPICPCARHAIANRVEGALGLLRYSLGGFRPRKTARLALSPARIHGFKVRIQTREERYFTVDSDPAGAGSSKSPSYPTQRKSKPNTRAAVKVHGVFSSCGG